MRPVPVPDFLTRRKCPVNRQRIGATFTPATMPEITHRTTCSPEEIDALKQFLKSRAPQLVRFIEVGAVVSKGRITSRMALGNTNTEWYNVGDIRSRKEYHAKFFRVDQMMAVLKSPQCHGRADLDLIQKYCREIGSGSFKSTITLFEKRNEIFIYDGNHSAVAFFEHYAQCNSDEINVEVFIITDTTLLRIFLIRCYHFFWYTLKNRKIMVRL